MDLNLLPSNNLIVKSLLPPVRNQIFLHFECFHPQLNYLVKPLSGSIIPQVQHNHNAMVLVLPLYFSANLTLPNFSCVSVFIQKPSPSLNEEPSTTAGLRRHCGFSERWSIKPSKHFIVNSPESMERSDDSRETSVRPTGSLGSVKRA